MTKGQRVKTDPELIRQMESAATEQKPVEAVFTLRPPAKAAGPVPSPEATEATVRAVLERVGKKLGLSPRASNVFRNLGSFVVVAEPPFIRELLSQPEIAAAIANRQPESAMMPPRAKRAAVESDFHEVGGVAKKARKAGARPRARSRP